MTLHDSLFELRKLIDWKQGNVLNREIARMLHEVDRELKFIIQQYRIYNSLKNKKDHGNL